VVAQWVAFRVDDVLGEDRSELDLSGLGTSIGLLALTAAQRLLSHRSAGSIAADVENRNLLRGLGQLGQPRLHRRGNLLDDSLDLPLIDVDRPVLGQIAAGGRKVAGRPPDS
jgi:hypothetical protein